MEGANLILLATVVISQGMLFDKMYVKTMSGTK